ncbi:MAG: hypothetical protein V4490_05620 [Pseudomonadota bacterium]
MQDSKQNSETQKPRAIELMESALSDLQTQLVKGDMEQIAKKAKVSERTVIRYVKEKLISDFGTGKKILDIGKQIVLSREQSLSAA